MSFPGSRPPGWRLKPIGKYGLPTSVDVPAAGLTLGRDEWSDCVIVGEHWTMVSRVHARVELIDGRLYVHDLDSTNGTFVNECKVASAEVASGDVLTLGPNGPRFLVYEAAGAVQTEVAEVGAVAQAATRNSPASLGSTALMTLKRALGLQEAEETTSRVQRTQKAHLAIALSTAGVLACAGIVAFSHLRTVNEADVQRVARRTAAQTRKTEIRVEEVERQTEELELATAELELANEEIVARLEQGLVAFGSELERRIAESYLRREAFESLHVELQARQRAVELKLEYAGSQAEASADEIAELTAELEDTRRRIACYDPLEIEAGKLAEVTHVRSAVVMIESRVVFREQESQRLLHSTVGATGESVVNLRNEGVVLDQRSSGSGFVISEDGYILTNAHVAVPTEFKDPMELTEENFVVPEVELDVVFSGSSKRLRAHLVRFADGEDTDFALIQIEPFKGMPHLSLGDLDAAPPEPGTEVYLCGFPLGTFAVQEGDRVIASTLKGILSRNVGPYIQIDAGVHPGISGGPLTDSKGRVIGVICSVQATPKGDIAAAIGYALPIGAARTVLTAESVR